MAVGPGCFFIKFMTPVGRFLAPLQYSRDTGAKQTLVLTKLKGIHPIGISVRFL